MGRPHVMRTGWRRCVRKVFHWFLRSAGGLEPTLNYERWWHFSQALLRQRVAAVFLYEMLIPVDSGADSPRRGCGGEVSCVQGPKPKTSLVKEWWFSGEHYDPLVIWQSRSGVDVESRWIKDMMSVYAQPSVLLSSPIWVKVHFKLISPSSSNYVLHHFLSLGVVEQAFTFQGE